MDVAEPDRDELAQRVLRCLSRRCVISHTTPLSLAVSGGADSVALGELLAGRHPLAAVLFVDHGLRDVSSERDAAVALADRIGAPFREARLSLAPGPNLQARARLERYRALAALAPAQSPIATGHTLSDQAETVLQRLLRGSGVSGLAGLSPRRGRIVRPLLEVSRRETRAAATHFIDDPTNATPRFQRNRVRQIIDILRNENPRIEQALADLATSCAASTRILDAVARATPDLDLRDLDTETATAFAHHLARNAAHGHSAASRKALEAWADALVTGGLGRVSLGDALAGVSNRGRATVIRDDDPRHEVVAPRPGTYHGAAMRLTLTVTTTPTEARPDAFDIPLEAVRWPLKLGRIPGARRAMMETLGAADLPEWQLVDATGQPLGPSASPPQNGPSFRIHAAFGPWMTPAESPVVPTASASVTLTSAFLSGQSASLGLPEPGDDPTQSRALTPCPETIARSGRSS